MAFPSKLILCWLSPCHEFHILLDRARITKTDGNYRLCFCRTWFSSSLDETWMSQANVNTELFICLRRTNKAKVLKLKGKIRMTLRRCFCRQCNKNRLIVLDDTFEYLGYSDNLAYTSGRPDLTTNWRCRVVPGSGFPDHAGGHGSLFSWCTKFLNSAEHKMHFVKVSQSTCFWKLDLLVVWTQGQHVPHRINQSQTLSIYLSNANQGFLYCSMSVRQKEN